MSTMFGRSIKSIAPLLLIMTVISGAAYAAEKKSPAAPVYIEPPYDRAEAFKTIINPHEQINDEGEVLWGRCLICHKNVPDLRREKSVKDVKLRYKEDLKDLCFRCHPTKKHPGGEGTISATMSGFAAPDHLVVPKRDHVLNMRLIKKEIATIIPLDPAGGKITCITCHNPHERGVLSGRADWGADTPQRLRTEGLDICQYCHRK